MSLADKRTAIADALSSVADVHGFAFRPSLHNTGDAWPLLGVLERADGGAFAALWRVFVVLPPNETAASQWIDAHWPDLYDALTLASVGHIEQMEPIDMEGQLALLITMRSEA